MLLHVARPAVVARGKASVPDVPPRAGSGALITPDVIACGWQLRPSACAWPGRTAGLSAAVFTRPGSCGLELPSPRDERTHVLTVELAPCMLEFQVDGRVVQDGPVAAGTAQVVRGGETPLARVSGDWRILQFYVPVAELPQLAADLGVPAPAARCIEIIDPGFTPDAVLAGIARRLDRRLARGECPERLELDEIALAIGTRLIRRHASVRPPRRPPGLRLSRGECRTMVELLADSHEPALADLCLLLGRPAAEVERAFGQAFRALPHQVRRSLRRRKPS
jgi:hypothetical protein